MDKTKKDSRHAVNSRPNHFSLGLRSKLIIIFLLVKIIPLIMLAAIAWRQVTIQGDVLQSIAINDSTKALNASAVENIERMSTDTAQMVASFLYGRDRDILYAASLAPTADNYLKFVSTQQKKVIKKGFWALTLDRHSWIDAETPLPVGVSGISTNIENNDMDGFHPRPPVVFDYQMLPLYDEMTFIDLAGNEVIKVLGPGSPKTKYPLSPEKKNVSKKENTYVKAEEYFKELEDLRPGEIYVSDVIGAYVGTNYIGMYTPAVVAKAAQERGYPIAYEPDKQAYAGCENPNGQRFEGIVRWATPVVNDQGKKVGYVTLALNHDHIMEYVDHLTPMNERYIELPSAFEGNYAFIWDYKGRNISHPRHHSIVGFDPETGEPQVPWLEADIYEGWQKSGLARWTDFVKDYPVFHEQSRNKKPAAALTKKGLVGLDCRYLNNAPQCTGWMDLTVDGGSGSFYILWSGLYKLNTAATIPYYTGRYAPSKDNNYSRRGFGFVAIGSGLESFTAPAEATAERLKTAIDGNIKATFLQLTSTTVILVVLVVFIAIWMASFLTKRITNLTSGISRFRAGERQFRFNTPVKDEFGILADAFDEMADSLEASMKNPVIITDKNEAIIYANSSAQQLLKKNLSGIVGKLYSEVSFYPPNSPYDPIKALHSGHEAEIFYFDEVKHYYKGTAYYLQNKNGEKTGYMIETSDVTEMVFRQIELERAMNEANRANEYKGEFLARMSHEIRTPMNAIIGLTSIVQKNLDDVGQQNTEINEVKDHIKQIENSSQHLMSLLNDILDLSKIDAGKISLVDETVDIRLLADTVTSIITPRCKEKDVLFETYFDDFSSTNYICDALRLRQVLINLLGNAVKFTPKNGKIEFHIHKKDKRDGKTLVEFLVRDNGIGIPSEAVNTIFQPFEQGGGFITSQFGGTGLGLAISRHIVQMMGGDIRVHSSEGQGSEFHFSLWLNETDDRLEKEETISDPTDKLTGKRVLLVDDVDLNRKIAKAMLKHTGIIIDDAEDGLDAVNKFSDSSNGSYDLVLMDVQMPNMNGYEASLAIRALDRDDAKAVPIIALTANAFKEDIDKAFNSGMNAHIAKPFKRDKLLQVLFKFLLAPDK